MDESGIGEDKVPILLRLPTPKDKKEPSQANMRY